MKRFIFIAYLFVTFNLFAATGALSGEKNLRVLKTYWFDIIYPERCEKSAAILYENADFIYEEVTEQYGLTPNARIPIVITPAVENFNAFWAVVPYSHIVLYDTSSDSLNELSVFSETLLSTFRHELTHAVTFTMKNGFWTGVTKIFGDAINIGPLLVSSGMAEGATVTSESAAGEGRLNDEYSLHLVKQAKIEGHFPSYYGVQGAGNLNPYYFNGAFHQWLQNEYGMEAYVKFWYLTINVQGLTVRKRFKKAFGEKLDKAWNRFIEDFQIPEVPANPVKDNQVMDFFAANKQNYSRLNDAGSEYVSLKVSKEKIYWLDKADRTIYSVEKNELGSEKLDFKKLFTQNGAYSINPSSDDVLLAVSTYADKKASITAQIKIYNISNKQVFTVPEAGLKDGAIILKDGQYYLVASKFVSPYNTIQIYKININEKNRITSVVKTVEKILPLNVFAASYTSLEGKFAFIEKNQMLYSICVSDLTGEILNRFAVPEERMVIHSISTSRDEENLYLSWAKPGTLPRAGMFNLQTKKYSLIQKDISGGVFTPVAVEDKIVYIGNFLNQNRLLFFTPDSHDCTTIPAIEFNSLAINESETTDFDIPESKNYNSLNYFKRGIFVPISFYSSEYFGPNYGKSDVFDTYLGVSYFTGAPWSDGTSDSILLTGGWSNFSKSAGFEVQTNFGTSTSLFTSTVDLKNEFDSNGWKLSSAEVTLNSGFHFGKISSIQLRNITEAKAGYQNPWIYDKKDFFKGHFEKSTDSIFYDLYDNVILSYSNAHYSGPGTYERTGISLGLGAYYLLDGAFDNSIMNIRSYDLYGQITGYIPKLLPFESKYGFTTNLPSTIEVGILPGAAKNYSIYNFSTETVLFGMLIKQPMPLINGIYLQNWKITAGYAGIFTPKGKNIQSGMQVLHLIDYTKQFLAGDVIYNDEINLKVTLKISPNMGILARNDFQADIYANLIYRLNNNTSKDNFIFDLGVKLLL